MKEVFPGVYRIGKALATRALVIGNVYGEEIKNGFRMWDPHRSKLSAAMLNGLGEMPIKPYSNVLYLGAATGTTVSHVSDIVSKGHVYAVEFSQVSMRKLLELAKRRKNVTPLLQDARRPADYQNLVGDVDVLYQDVAQPDQSEILARNARTFLKADDYAIICVKARSISSIAEPGEVFRKEKEKLGEDFEVREEIDLGPYDRDHRMYVLRFKGA